MHFPKESIPEKTEFGDLAPTYMESPKGLDVDALLQGLPGNMCPCPHWGYAVKGTMLVKYSDGTEEEITAGDVYYLSGRHTAEIKEDFACVEFSPKQEWWEVAAVVAKNMGA